MLDLVKKLEDKLDSIDQMMSDPELLSDQKKMIELNRERRYVADILETGHKYKEAVIGISDAKEIIEAA